MLVASRYQTSQGSLVFGRQLIGSGLFPFYVKALGIIIGASLAIHVIVLIALAVAGAAPTVGDSLGSIALQVLIQFVVITSIFASVDRSLPALPLVPQQLGTQASAERKVLRKPYRVSRPDRSGRSSAVSILLFWLGFVYRATTVVFGPLCRHVPARADLVADRRCRRR